MINHNLECCNSTFSLDTSSFPRKKNHSLSQKKPFLFPNCIPDTLYNSAKCSISMQFCSFASSKEEEKQENSSKTRTLAMESSEQNEKL